MRVVQSAPHPMVVLHGVILWCEGGMQTETDMLAVVAMHL